MTVDLATFMELLLQNSKWLTHFLLTFLSLMEHPLVTVQTLQWFGLDDSTSGSEATITSSCLLVLPPSGLLLDSSSFYRLSQ